jgi:hypothetical protein
MPQAPERPSTAENLPLGTPSVVPFEAAPFEPRTPYAQQTLFAEPNP